MKKIMFMLAVAAIAVSANAASLKWLFASGTSAAVLDSAVVGNSTVYLLMDTGAAALQSEKAAIWAALKADSSYDITSSSKYVTTLATDSDGKILSTAKTLDGTSGTKYYFAAVIVSDDYVYLGAPANNTGSDSLQKTVTVNIGATAMNDMDTASANTPGWYQFKTSSADIPEPTSGLLMLVGLGALALRRRRA